MDPSTGSFTSMDSFGGYLDDPISQNKYLFANGNPVMGCDPSGYYTLQEEVTTIGIIDILYEASVASFKYMVKTEIKNGGNDIDNNP